LALQKQIEQVVVIKVIKYRLLSVHFVLKEKLDLVDNKTGGIYRDGQVAEPEARGWEGDAKRLGFTNTRNFFKSKGSGKGAMSLESR
jgi:hypothetical protein